MASSFEFIAELRTETGTSAAKTMRKEGKVPAILYGGGEPSIMLVLEHNQVVKNLENEAIYSHILNVKYDGKEQSVILKALQRYPGKPIIMHADFQRISKTEKIRVHVPLHFINESSSEGVKAGGIVTHNIVDVEISCLPDLLPEFIEVDLAAVEMGELVHLSDLVVADGVEITALAHGSEYDAAVAAINAERGGVEEEAEATEESEGEESAGDSD